MRFVSLAVACALVACGPRAINVEHEAGLEFGNVATGQSHDLELKLTNTGKAPAQLTLSVDSSDFTIDESAITILAGSTTALTVHFAPTALGPRTGTLSLGASTVALSGRGIGPKLSVPSEVTLPPITIVTAQPIEALAMSVTLRNVGTSGSLLRLNTPRVDGSPELCVGTFSGSTCVAWEPPSVLDTQTLLEVPLSILPTSAGAKSWTVAFPSNDPVNSEVTLVVRVRVESFEPCVFEAPTELVLRNTAALTIRHVGPGTCLVRSIATNPPDALRLVAPIPAPTRLESNGTLTIVLNSVAPFSFPGFVRVEAAGTEPFYVPVRREFSVTDCLVISPASLDFGAVPLTCNSPIRNVQLYNACSAPLVIDNVRIAAGAGEAPGSPHCAGTTPCPEFFITTGIPNGTTIAGSTTSPAIIGAEYRPINYGPDTGAIAVTLADGGVYLLALQGRGDAQNRNTDTFRQDTRSISDVLVMIDASPSFVSKRGSVRENLMVLLRAMSSPCIDGRLAFAPADGAADAGVRFQPNDAGSIWSHSLEPNFVERALSSFDSLPVGSELEACIGPAADLIDDAGVRDGGYFSGVCVTDALESSSNPSAALQRFMRHGRQASWSSVAAFGNGSCNVEAIDDGVHQGLATAGFGETGEICNPDWGESVFPTGSICSFRSSFYLSSRPDGPIEVRIDGVLSPLGNWTYDVASNAVIFVPAFVPPSGSTITVTYDTACL